MNVLRFEQESKTGPENTNFGLILRIRQRLRMVSAHAQRGTKLRDRLLSFIIHQIFSLARDWS